MRYLTNWLKISLLTCGLISVTACNTVKGMGQDLQKAGAKIEDIAKK